jgi:hypothetical protein
VKPVSYRFISLLLAVAIVGTGGPSVYTQFVTPYSSVATIGDRDFRRIQKGGTG